MGSAGAFIRLARPHFLVGGALLYAVGAGTANSIDIADYLLGQAMVTTAQVTAHFVNEYADVEADRLVANRTWFSGGSGVLSDGSLAPQIALRAGLATTLLAAIFAIMVARQSAWAASLGLVALGISWLYSIPPVRLLATGWGEAATSLVVAVLVPLIGALANGGGMTSQLLWALPVLFLIHFAMMLAFELPDVAADRAAGKTVLAVRVGAEAAQVLIAATLGLAAATAAAGMIAGAGGSPLPLAAAGITGLILLFAARQDRFGLITSAAVATLVLAGVAALLGAS